MNDTRQGKKEAEADAKGVTASSHVKFDGEILSCLDVEPYFWGEKVSSSRESQAAEDVQRSVTFRTYAPQRGMHIPSGTAT